MKRMQPMSIDELKKVLGLAKNEPRDYALLMLMATHLFRTSEVAGEVIRQGIKVHAGLRVEDVNLKDRLLTARSLKGSLSTTEAMTAPVCEALEAWLKVKPASPWLFPSTRNDGPISRNQTYRIVRHYCELAGLKTTQRSGHAIRHTIAQHMADSGKVNVRELQRMGRWKNLNSVAFYFDYSQKHIDAKKGAVLGL